MVEVWVSDGEGALLGTVIHDGEAGSIFRIVTANKLDVEQSSGSKRGGSANVQQPVSLATDQFREDARRVLGVVSIDVEGERVVRRSGDHGAAHHDVTVDGASAAEGTAEDVDDGAVTCGESAIDDGASGELIVIGADVEQARIRYFHSTEVCEGSAVQRALVVYHTGVDECAGAQGGADGVADHAAIEEYTGGELGESTEICDSARVI